MFRKIVKKNRRSENGHADAGPWRYFTPEELVEMAKGQDDIASVVRLHPDMELNSEERERKLARLAQRNG